MTGYRVSCFQFDARETPATRRFLSNLPFKVLVERDRLHANYVLARPPCINRRLLRALRKRYHARCS